MTGSALTDTQPGTPARREAGPCAHNEVGVSYGAGRPVGTCLGCGAALSEADLAERTARDADPQPLGGEYEGLKERLISDTPIYTKGPDYEPLMVPAEAIRHEAAKAITDLQERLSRVEGALEPFARLEIPKRSVGNAGAYSILHDHIRAAAQALSTTRTED